MADIEKVIKGLECCAGQCNYHGCPYKDPCENANGVKQIMLDALELLKEQQPKKGHWFIDEYEYLDCSVCGESYYTGCETTEEAKRRLANGEHYKFCPYCGADMRGEQE